MLPVASIPFPPLDPIAFHVGPLAVRWYGLAYLAAFLAGFSWLRQMSRIGQLRMPVAQLGDLVSWLVVGVMAGGRLGWWIFYHRNQGAMEPWYEPLALWHGGMSFHGGLIGVTLAAALYAWRHHVPFWNLADCAALVTPVGLFFGRLANFVNAELVGRPTGVPWGVVFPGDVVPRHPSQLYEAMLEGPLLLLALWLVWRRARPAEGRTAALFLILYGTFRFLLEFTRQPDPQLGFIAFGWLSMGQLLSVGLIVVGAFAWLARRPGGRTKPEAGPERQPDQPALAAAAEAAGQR